MGNNISDFVANDTNGGIPYRYMISVAAGPTPGIYESNNLSASASFTPSDNFNAIKVGFDSTYFYAMDVTGKCKSYDGTWSSVNSGTFLLDVQVKGIAGNGQMN